MPEEKQETETTNTGVFANLPLISKLPSKKMKEAQKMLEEMESLDLQITTASERQTEIKDKLQKIQNDHELEGLRFGGLCFRAIKIPGRKTLDKTKLVENGCALAIIEASYKTGEGSVRREFKRIDL